MIQQYYYSTLNNKIYDNKYDAEKAEDEYVENYFNELNKRAAIKRRKMRSMSHPSEKSVKKIYID